MPSTPSRAHSADSHSSAEYTNVCRASIKRKLSQSQSQPRMARSNASSDNDEDGDASSPQRGRQARRQEKEESESGSELDVSDDQEDDSDSTRIRKREARDSHAKKSIRKRYRRLQEAADGLRTDLTNTTMEALGDVLDRSNKAFDKVQGPAEAVLDSKVLIATSEAGALKARQLKIDADAFDTDEFLVRLAHFMGGRVIGTGGRAGGRRGRRAGSDEEEEEKPWAWGKVGKVLSGESKRPAILEHMYGPLQLEIKEKKARTQRQKAKFDESQKMRPEELHAEDVAKNENETGKVTARIAKRLMAVAGEEGIPYLRFIINPHSFSQTVENMFYFSFLVREQKVALEVDDNPESPWAGDMIAYVVDPGQAAATLKSAETVKHQVVLELTQDVWKEAIEAYDIDEPMIPMREDFVPATANGKKKWG
ncbi:Smc5-Smc6 complex subunit NSE4 [Sporobolomyces salmoneus]|uniref:Smc5-Smc6 complex subunit NSE4 n=1 Tax=Sporobolomyces salmoneus TaxID=183962 RepID=UPI00316EE5B3